MNSLKEHRLRAFFAALLIMCLLCGGALAQENLLSNPEIDLSEGQAAGWSADAWDMNRSAFAVDENGLEGGCLYISNMQENDARFVQRVAVEPNTVYRFSCHIKAQGAFGAAGANISVGQSHALSTPVYDTNGEWVETSFYGVTGEDQTEIAVYLRLGGYSATTTGEAWFDRVSVQKAEHVPEDVHVQLLESISSSAQAAQAEAAAAELFAEEESSPQGGMIALSAGTLVFAAAFMGIYLYGAKNARVSLRSDEKKDGWMIDVLLLTALLARLLTALFVRGFETDINCFLGWSQRVFETGPSGFYAPDAFCDYPPGYMFVLWLSGALRDLLGQNGSGMGAVLLIKLPNILADVVVVAMLYSLAKKRIPSRAALLPAAAYALNPAVVIDSAGWGQTDGLLAALLLGAFVLATDKKWLRCMAVFALAVLVKPQALLFAPLGLIVLVIETVRAQDKGRMALQAVGGVALAVAVWIGLSLPFALSQVSVNYPDAPGALQPVLWLFEKYFGTLGSYSYYTVSACNLWDLLGLNWVEIVDGPEQWIGWASFGAAFGFAAWMYAADKSGRRLCLIAAAALTIMYTFGLKMHERYLFPAIAFLCLAASEDQDARIPVAALLVSCAQMLNMGLVLLYDYTLFAPRALVVFTDLLVIGSCALLVWTCADLCLREHAVTFTRIYRPSSGRLDIQEKRAQIASGSGLFQTGNYKMNLTRKERLAIAAVTALYSVFTFVNLGTLSAPQTSWTSSMPGEQLVFDLGQEQKFMLTYYGGICDSSFTVEFSSDGENYSEPGLAQYDQGEIFRWLWYRPMLRGNDGSLAPVDADYSYQTARYVRLTTEQSGLVLSEVAFLSEEGEPLPIASVTTNGAEDPLLLIDEQQTVPEHPSYFNSSYFDEIYHVRTAYEHIHGMHAYEWTHPPLGKLLIALGIKIFGMSPFGWRFAGALSGVVMVPLAYLLMRQISRSKLASFFAMMLMTLDCMHFTQSRLGTIDCFAVMFIMLMYLFMFRYVRMNFYHAGLKKTLVPLTLCGLSFALGCATKWICIYAGVGLAVLFFWSLARRYLEYRHAAAGMRAFAPKERKIAQQAVKVFWHNAVITCLWCVVFFVVVPLLTYYFSYYWHLAPDGAFNVASVVELQKGIMSYHSGLGDDGHFFRSPWYEWPLIVKPMWYYSGNAFYAQDTVSSISCMGNPAVWWGGLAGLVYVLVKWIRSGCKDNKCLVLLVGFASQYMPWVLVPRSTFIYHYFASVPFIILCAGVLIEDIERKDRGLAKKVVGVWVGAAALLCAAFYPLMSGTPIPRAYAKWLRWFNWYNY
ncbi:MAG: glycosyltransferase family 39 protein [Eubacteriales bacterium]|nr:glycosyltransferase family 39 protein [Eubacteriales bacterium]